MLVKVDPNSPLVQTRNRTLRGRQQLPQHKKPVGEGPETCCGHGFICVRCGEWDKGNGRVFPSRCTSSSPAFWQPDAACGHCAGLRLCPCPLLCRLSLLPLLHLPVQPCCLASLHVKPKSLCLSPKITPVVCAPPCSLHTSLSRLPQLNGPPLSRQPSWTFSTFISVFSGCLSSRYTLSCLQIQPTYQWPLPFATLPNFTSFSLLCITS